MEKTVFDFNKLDIHDYRTWASYKSVKVGDTVYWNCKDFKNGYPLTYMEGTVIERHDNGVKVANVVQVIEKYLEINWTKIDAFE